MIQMAAVIFIAYVLDFCFGDPLWVPHPICLIGKLISAGEKAIRAVFPKTKRGETAGGAVLVGIVMLVCVTVPALILFVLKKIHPMLAFSVQCLFCYQILAARSLKTESMKVYRALKTGSLPLARKQLSYIVGRDTEQLDEEAIVRATVETVAENSSDGVIAPLLFMMIGGAPLGFLYKAVNTMDSMLGYKNEKYLYFGRCAAKTDDVFNWIPSRLTALLSVAAAYIGGFSGAGAWRIFCRDRYNHASPNSAQTESVYAGAMDIQLAGDAVYFGKVYRKPTIGDAVRKVNPEDIVRANRLLFLTAFLGTVFCCIILMIAEVL